MTNLWERFDNIAKPEEVMEAKSQFLPIEAGEYKVLLEDILAKENKNGLPMLSSRFRLMENNKVLFHNLNLQVPAHQWITDKNIAEAILLIEGLLEDEIEFTGLSALAELVSTIPLNGEYLIKVSYGEKDKERSFPNVEVLDKPESIDDIDTGGITDDDVPF